MYKLKLAIGFLSSYQYHISKKTLQIRYKIDSEDGVDDTLFDCTQISSESALISSESEFEVMRPEKNIVIAEKPSFREIRYGAFKNYQG